MATAINEHLMQNMLGILWLISITAIFAIGFFAAMRDIRPALSGGLFAGMFLSLFLRITGFIPDVAFYTMVVLGAASLVFVWRR
jgi:hypothetical protein